MDQNNELNLKIVDITYDNKYSRYMYKCLAHIRAEEYSPRKEYIEMAKRHNLHKKLLFIDNNLVGQIEYCKPKASPYPIYGENIIILNCIWVLRKAKGKKLGKILLNDLIEKELNINGIATIAFKNHPSPWFKIEHMKYLGFSPIDKITVRHVYKHPEKIFSIYLMWRNLKSNVEKPKWNKRKMLKGVIFCIAHPLYSPKNIETETY